MDIKTRKKKDNKIKDSWDSSILKIFISGNPRMN